MDRAAPALDKNFNGIAVQDSAPPDPNGAVGNDSVIATGNYLIEARNKGGHLQWRASLLELFFPLLTELPPGAVIEPGSIVIFTDPKIV